MNVINHIFLERTLRDYIARELEPYRLDNAQVNIVQPDQVPFDPQERARSLVLKMPPVVVCGHPPKTVTGFYDTKALPQSPYIAVRATGGVSTFHDPNPIEECTVVLVLSIYDQEARNQGHQVILNIVDVLQNAFFRDRVIDDSYSLIAPISWELVDGAPFPYWQGQMSMKYQLPLPSHIKETTIQTPPVPPHPELWASDSYYANT